MANVQIIPAKVRVVPNVKLIKNIIEFDAETYQDLLGGEEGGVIEKRNHKKFGEVITTYKIANADGYDDDSPLTEFDAAVLSACLSEQKIGNDHSTSAIILRALTGKVGKHDARREQISAWKLSTASQNSCRPLSPLTCPIPTRRSDTTAVKSRRSAL